MWEERTEKQPVRAFVPRLQRIRIRRHCNEQSRTGGKRHACGVKPEEIKEAVYHCALYIGLGKAENAVNAVNAVFAEKGIVLPLTVCLPYIGFPRTLNALSCINEVLPEAKQ